MHTTDPKEAAKFIAMFECWLGTRKQLPIVGLDLEYTKTKPARAALLQLCMCDHCLIWDASLARRYCPELINFLNRPDISFATMDKRQDISKFDAMGVHIPNHVDIQDYFVIPGTNGHAGTAAMAALVIDPTYAKYKNNFDKDLHYH
jgi:hypothetical protein